MSKRDGKSNCKRVASIVPQAVSGDVNGVEVDVKGFDAVTLVAHGDGTAVGTVKIQETDTSGSGYADVAAEDVLGVQDNAVDATDTSVTIGYIGLKRYVRAVWTNTTPGDVCVGFDLGHPALAPVSGND
jgi:hypothetical protein